MHSPTSAPTLACSLSTTVRINTGTEYCGLDFIGGIKWLGIPYAVPPIRFAPPQPLPVQLNATVIPIPATTYGPSCPQPLTKPNTIMISEDCLTLNIFAPAGAHGDTAVMVFLLGFMTGLTDTDGLNGINLAALSNVVIVTVNSRVGALGYLASSLLRVNGNYGILDQQMALKFISQNIKAFGGNPKQVTIFGDHGAAAVGAHLISIPSSKSLFRAAIMESNPFGIPFPTPSQMDDRTTLFWSCFCNATSHHASPCTLTLDNLRQAPLELILQADAQYSSSISLQLILTQGLPGLIPWSANVDGHVIVNQPFTGFAPRVPLKPFIFGWNRNDSVGMLQNRFMDGGGGIIPPFQAMMLAMFGANGWQTIQTTQTITHTLPYDPINAPATSTYGGNVQTSALNNIIQDGLFRCANLIFARDVKFAKPGAKIWGYDFAGTPQTGYVVVDSGDTPASCSSVALANACTGAERPFVFGDTLESYPKGVPSNLIRLQMQMMKLWSDFAKNGVIGGPLQAPSVSPTTWPPFDGTYVFKFGTASTSTNEWDDASCDMWRDVFVSNNNKVNS